MTLKQRDTIPKTGHDPNSGGVLDRVPFSSGHVPFGALSPVTPVSCHRACQFSTFNPGIRLM
jgi:hypothetical protein